MTRISQLYTLSLALLSAGLLLSSCTKEDDLVAPDFDLFGEVTGTAETETDGWIRENLNKPFNIDIIWRWNTKEVPYGKSYIPPMEQNVLPYAKILRNTFLKSYQEVKGNEFIKPLVPKQFLFLGEYGYNNDGTITLGQAESGNKITFFGINYWDEQDSSGDYPNVRQAIHTLYHEFGHILHQNKLFSEDFQKISKADYTAQWYNENEPTARIKGFASTYSMLNQNEDFVELIAYYCTMTPEQFDAHINSEVNRNKEGTTEYAEAVEGRDKILQKVSLIRDYLKSSWEIDLDEIRDATLKNVELSFEDQTIFPNAAPMISGSAVYPYSHNLRSCDHAGLEPVSGTPSHATEGHRH